METLWQDVKYGARMLAKNRSVTLVAVLTLALGIGANTAIFTVVQGVLLRPLPYSQPDRLVHLWETRQRKDFEQMEASYPNFMDWNERSRSFSGLAGYNQGGGFLRTPAGKELIRSGRGTANFFDVLGVKPAMGRTFREEDGKVSPPTVVLLTHGFWQRHFGGDADVVGKSLALNDRMLTIIGVLPADFHFAPVGTPDIWVPLAPRDDMLQRRNLHWVNVIGRLKDGNTSEQALTEMNGIAKQLEREYPEANAGAGVRIFSLSDQVVGPTRPVLLVLMAAVGFVLLIACVNVANLLLGRVASRSREIAIRTALGAGRGRVIRQLLVESGLLALAGGAFGAVLALWGVDAMVSVFPEPILASMPYLSGIQVHWGVLAFNFGVAGIAGILFGLAPALDATKRELHQSLKESARASGGVSHRRMRGLLVVSEVALVLVVLTGAGLTLRSLAALFERDPGFQAEHLIALDVDLPGQKYEKAPQMANFWKQLLEQVRALPGVQSAGTTSRLPLAGGGNTIRLYAQGKPVPPPGSENEANIREVSPGYFQTMGIPLLAGRSVDQQDEQGKQRVCVLNQDLAKRLFGEEDPVGRSIVFTFNKSEWRIVGVVGNAEFDTLDGRGNPAIYTSVLQDADDYATLIVRTSSTPSAMVPAIRDTVKAIDPDVPVFAVRTIDDIIAATPSIFFRKYLSVLLGGFALLGMLLAAVGIFGVMSYGVTQRTREFGIRAALGAARGDVLRLVMAGGMKLALTGVALGLAGSLAVGRAMQTVLFGVEPYDPLTFAGVSVLLLGVAVLACLVPARRATKIDPMVALRYE